MSAMPTVLYCHKGDCKKLGHHAPAMCMTLPVEAFVQFDWLMGTENVVARACDRFGLSGGQKDRRLWERDWEIGTGFWTV